ncbi:ACP phosphodiesterase [Epilithonimonas sp. JDS]|uniref:acyl carrier protein phosphodiesterase n=1 Tax=Epilithonimonas sp. JDS TaxID=2902797 RepID=UPI001E590079|nr:ACP phosphodiesterase [Epilithonimonas sp. JDS]MCD9855064.1 ACP phosphodiesterase [Epilithonimonas sp. JDS]
MNYLAHSILSFSDGQLVGNMIADFIKNNERENFPPEIQEGIKLHRAIDTFTDAHPAVSEAKKIFSPLVRLYSGAFVDVAFDYFVAHLYTEQDLKIHSAKAYKILWENEEWLPEHYKKMLIRMEHDDWLTNYRQDQGIKFSMQNVLHKAKYLEKDIPVFDAFLQHKPELQTCFDQFFPDILAECKNNFGII